MIDIEPPESGSDRAWHERLLWWGRTAGIVALAVVVAVYGNQSGRTSPGPLLILLLVLTVTSGLGLRIAELRGSSSRLKLAVVVVFSACATCYGWIGPIGPGVAFIFIAVAYSGVVLPTRQAFPLSAAIVAVSISGLLVHSEDTLAALTVPIAATTVLGGIARRTYAERVANAQIAVAQAERARVAENRSGALAERSRIARDIHDVLAHSLAALSMQLEAADAVLAAGDIDRGRQAVARARTLARDGMLETRRAVSALRAGLAPLPEALQELAGTAGERTELTVRGTPRDLDAQAQLALYRAAQESLANVHKHAPGASIQMELTYAADATELTVGNGQPGRPASALHDTGSGLGLAGMRERIAGLAGTVEAGPLDGGWQVHVRIPQ